MTEYRQIGHRLAEGQVLGRIGYWHQAQGEVDLARQTDGQWCALARHINPVQLQSLGLAKHAGDCRGELPAVGNLGSSLQAAGRLEAALEQF